MLPPIMETQMKNKTENEAEAQGSFKGVHTDLGFRVFMDVDGLIRVWGKMGHEKVWREVCQQWQ